MVRKPNADATAEVKWRVTIDYRKVPYGLTNARGIQCPFELQAWGTIAHRGPRGEGWLLAGRGFRIILIDLSAPFSTFRISSSRAFYTFLPVQLYMIPAGQATPACTDLIDLSRLRVNYS